MNQPVNNNITINMLGSSVQGVVENVIEEFSEPEDLMEGIRDVDDGSIADEESLDKRRTINEIVHELKLEVEPCAAAAELAAAVAAASAGNDDQSILPHVNVQTLEYVTQANNGDTSNDRDPLGAVVRTDGLLVDFQLF
ncbi:unnamed protein product [Trichogramma brassicae]|uniref:Uncharacterized protein n=1 Tax=Trichogramma brassicae TaxID=86971 RepID=A0A6H5ID97_9HYME|nr:unnamed protein product [Trichogramma brassicae]